MDFKSFKKNKNKLSATIEKHKAEKPSYADDRFWKLTMDASKVGEAVIRFLPVKDVDVYPIAHYLNHSFQKNGQWFWENCPKTLDMSNPCPVCEHAQPYWDEKTDASEVIAMKFSRKKNYIANILVVNDTAKPENNGKVFLFKFGKKIYDKINAKLAPKSELVEASIVYDLWEGQNFRIATEEVKKFVNYDQSAFYDAKTPIAETDKEMAAIYDKIYDLDEFTAENKFSSYEAITKKFNAIMRIKATGTTSTAKKETKDTVNDMVEENTSKPVKDESKPSKVEETEPETTDDDMFDFGDDDFGDDDITF